MKFVAIDPGYLPKEVIMSAKKVKGISNIEYYEQPPSDKDELFSRVKDAEIVTSRLYIEYNKELFNNAPKLQAILNTSVGFNNIDLKEATKRGIKVYNSPGYNARSVAEFAFSLIVSIARKIPASQEHVRAGGIKYRPFEGFELANKTIGVIGSGNVGSKIVQIAKGFDMNILVHTKNPSDEKAKNLGIDKFTSFQEVLKKSDILVLAVPLTKETKGLVGKEELKLMKKTAILINVARQTVVDEFALAERLLKGQIGGAALDMVLEDPFQINDYPLEIQEMVNLPNVIVTPHIGGETKEANDRLGDIFIQNVKNAISGSLENCVNF